MSNVPRLADVSLIVPLAPGETAWRALLSDLEVFGGELILVGTTPEPDDFPECIKPLASQVLWLNSPPGRAIQQNRGAEAASRSYVWFVHADSRLTGHVLSSLDASLAARPKALYFFDLEFAADGPWMTRLNAWGARFRSRVLKLPFGDQGLCLPRAEFFQLGAFDERARVGEDHLLVWAAHRAGLPVLPVGAPLVTSARKYRDRGWLRTTARHLLLTLLQAFPEWIRCRWKTKDSSIRR